MPVQQHAMHEKSDGTLPLLGIGDTSGRRLDGLVYWFGCHGSIFRPGSGAGFAQLVRTFLTADFDDMAANGDLDGVSIQLAITSGATFLDHRFLLHKCRERETMPGRKPAIRIFSDFTDTPE